jgi:hypothetical protein
MFKIPSSGQIPEEFFGYDEATDGVQMAHLETRVETWLAFGRYIFLHKPVVS